MKKFILIMILIVTLTALIGVSGCNNNKNDGVIRLNEVTHSVFYAPLYVAINKGYFLEEGITIELTNGGGADKSMTAVISGQADIAFCGPEATIYVYNEGRTDYPKVFAGLTKKDGSFIVGRNAESFDWKTSLKGKEIIGGRKGGVPAMALEYALKENGYTIGNDVTINYDVQFDLITPAFESGTGDYCTMFEPNATAYERQGKGYNLASVGLESGDIPYTCFSANESYLKNNTEQIKGFLRALKKGVEFVKNSTAEEIAFAVKDSFSASEVEILATAIDNYKKIGAYTDDLRVEKSAFDRLQEIIISAGVYDEKVPYSQIVDNSYLDEL